MSIEVSIILPSYNRYPLNLLTLHSLEYQTFAPSKMEVILIDDASTDDTHLLKNYHPPYSYQYIRNTRNEGRSKTRNKGIQVAKGKILIFLDAEIIVDRHFVQCHYQKQLTDEPVVITGQNLRKLFSFLYSEFTPDQLKAVEWISKESSKVRNRVKKGIRPEKFEHEKLPSLMKGLKRPVQLLFPKDFRSFSDVKLFSSPMNYYQNLINLLRDDFHLPWIVCNGFHSVKKERVVAVGGFDEDFNGHGLEDFEYGFRLYKAGVKFAYDPKITAYHQEHPIGSSRSMEGNQNLIRFQQKHPYLDICLLSLTRMDNWDYRFMDKVLREHQVITQRHPAAFDTLTDALLVLLKQIPLLIAEGKPVADLLKVSGFGSDEEWKSRLFLERNALEANGFTHVTRLLDLLVRL
ncbi:MAG: hypothetical protein K0R47_4988 [Brevibacillus sp.]|nr:hypothetical protein [Brevibacillus sp.]